MESLIDNDKDAPIKPPDAQSDADILAEARKRRVMCEEAEGDNRVDALDDLRFITGGEAQWDARAVMARKADGRPIITVNVMPTYLHQVTNDQRMNSPAIKVHPVDDNADIETAKVIQGLIRHIEYDSNADVAYDTAVNSAAAIGFGYFRLITDYADPKSFDQKIMFQRIPNALSVRLDPLNTEPDGSGIQFAFVECLMSREDFKREWPEATANNQSLLTGGDQSYIGWLTDNAVLVCDYYRIEKTAATVCLLQDGSSGYKDELPEAMHGLIVKEREGFKQKVMLYKVTGCDILKRTQIMCNWIPVFPVYGDEVNIEGKIIRSGIVRNAKGPAQSYNVFMTSATEEVALRSKSPYMMAEGQEEGHEDEFAQANIRAFPYLTYKPVDLNGNLAPPPQRQPMADIPAGMLAMAAHAADNIKKTTGLFDASLGARGTATSGKQELAQQREGDMANFHYMDGLLRTIRHVGRCIVSMIPHYYDTQRVVRILGEDDTAEYATLNQPNEKMEASEDGAIREVLNNVTVGEYDVTVSSGPAFSTLRQEAAEGMGEAMAKNPALWPIIGDLYIRSQDWPNAEEIAERLEKTIDPRLLDDDDKPQEVIQTPRGPLPLAQVPQVLQALEMEIAQRDEVLQKGDAAKQEAELMKQQNAAASLNLDAQKVETERFRAETERFKAEEAAAVAEANALTARMKVDIDAKAAEVMAINGDTTAFEAWRATLESDTRLRLGEIAARSAERRTAMQLANKPTERK